MNGKILLFLVLSAFIIISGCTGQTDETVESTSPPSTVIVSSTESTQSTYVCYWDWKFGTTDSIGYDTAPAGYTYAIVTLYLQNDGPKTVSTNPWNWELWANGITYRHDSNTYSEYVNHQTVDVRNGGEIVTQMVFLIQGDVTSASLIYDNYHDLDMVQIDYFYKAVGNYSGCS